MLPFDPLTLPRLAAVISAWELEISSLFLLLLLLFLETSSSIINIIVKYPSK